MSAATKVQRHGTYARYQQHNRQGETPCDACREAAAQYARDYRARAMPGAVNEKANNRARHRALWRLAQMYPADFNRLVFEEQEKEARWSA